MKLSGIKILDFSRLLPGPFATMLLADMGADILRIEHPTKPDLIKSYGPMRDAVSTLFVTLNHRKRSLKLDLRQEESIQKVKELIKEYDIILEGFRPGVMQSLQLDYKTLSEENPGLIYCSLTGYGQETAKTDRAGHDINYLAQSGIPSYSGIGGPPILGTQIADLSGSLYTVQSILAAIIQRYQTKKGCYIDVSMRDTVLSLGILANNAYLNGNMVTSRGDGLLNGGGLYDYYQTKDDKYLAVGSLEPKFRDALLETLEIDSREKNEDELKKLVAGTIRSHPLDHWVTTFESVDACIEAVLTVDEVFDDPDISIEEADGVSMMAHPVKFRS